MHRRRRHCRPTPPSLLRLREEEEAARRRRACPNGPYGHHIFDSGNYEEAMEKFAASKVDINCVLSLYPFILLLKAPDLPESGGLESHSDASLLSRMPSDVSDDMEGTSPLRIPETPVESTDIAALEQKKMSHNALKKINTVIEKATSEGTEQAVADVVQGSIVSSDYYQPTCLRKSHVDVHVSSGAREISSILDTALTQALLLTGQSSSALELLKGPNYCNVKIFEGFLRQHKFYLVLIELLKCIDMHHEAPNLLSQLVEETDSDHADPIHKFTPEMLIQYLKPLCGSDPILVLDFPMKVLERHPSETIDLFLSGGVPPDLVNSYLKQHSPEMQATYLEHMLSTNEHGITANLQNDLVQFYLSQVLDCYVSLSAQKEWNEEEYSPTRRKLISALENTTGYNPETLLKRLPLDALYEERVLPLGRMQQHHLALSLYVHKGHKNLHRPELALAYCDRVYENALCQTGSTVFSNIYLILLQIYLNPEKSTKESEQRMLNLSSSQVPGNQKVGASIRRKGTRGMKKIAEIEGADDLHWNASSTGSGKSDVDGDEINKEVGFIMTDEAIDLLSLKWNRINGAQALRLLPKYTKLQVKEELYMKRKRMVTISSETDWH
ncbi:Vam6/Vps39-like protein [Nymphaea thermarum]|nr:Vam6/Vps39-like protein [Nymphaea thermarum]